MSDVPRPDAASRGAALDFVDGPSLRDAIGPAIELVGHADWLVVSPSADLARGHGLEMTGWLRKRFGLANL